MSLNLQMASSFFKKAQCLIAWTLHERKHTKVEESISLVTTYSLEVSYIRKALQPVCLSANNHHFKEGEILNIEYDSFEVAI